MTAIWKKSLKWTWLGRDNKSRHIIAELNAVKRLWAERPVEYYVNSENFISNVNHRLHAYDRAI